MTGGAISGVTNYSVSGTTSLGANVTTSGTQTYSGAVTLLVNTILTGTTITTGSTLAGGANSLTVTGNAVTGGVINGVTNFSVSGTTSLGANVTTTGTQTYSGAVTLLVNTILTGTDPTFGAGLIGAGHDLALNFSGTTAIDGTFTGIRNLSTANGGITTLSGTITTTGTQTYSDAVLLLANTTLTGTTITTSSTLAGGGNSLTVTGNAATGGAISGVTNYAVSGTTSLGANVTTSGTQTYAGLVTLLADATLTGSVPTFATGVLGGGHSLVLVFSGTTVINSSFTGINNLSTSGGGTTTLAGTINTTGFQRYSDAVVLVAQTTLSSAAGNGNIDFGNSLDSADSGVQTLTVAAGRGSITFQQGIGNSRPLAGLTLQSAASVRSDAAIQLDGTSQLARDGLTIAAGVNAVSLAKPGSQIRNFAGSGIVFGGGSTGSELAGFTISSNGLHGIQVGAGDYANSVIRSNTITGNGSMATHQGDGILVQGFGLLIGGDVGAGNTISGNAFYGIEVAGAAANSGIRSNSIFLNGHSDVQTTPDGSVVAVGGGIRLTNGGNQQQVAPEILKAVRDAASGVIRVQFSVRAAGTFQVQFFRNTPADERRIFPVDISGFEGRDLVLTLPAVTGNTPTTAEISAASLSAGDWLTATATAIVPATAPATAPATSQTSAFSQAMQMLAAPDLAVGTAGSSSVWERELAYVATGPATMTISGLTAAQVKSYSAINPTTKAPVFRGTSLLITPTGGISHVIGSIATATASGSNLIVSLSPGATPLQAGTPGTLVLSGVPLPAARLVNASDLSVPLQVGESEIAAALALVTTITEAQRNAFVTRFQGGLRVAAQDIDSDGYTDLVTAPGGVPGKPSPKTNVPVGQPGTAPDPLAPKDLSRTLGNVFGSAARVVTIYNGNTAAAGGQGGGWTSASVDVTPIFGTSYYGGFQVAVGNVRQELSGKQSGVIELVVASTNLVAVYEIRVESRGAQPKIDPDRVATFTVSGTITGLATGNFSTNNETGLDGRGLADIVVATTTAGQSAPGPGKIQPKYDAPDTARVTVFTEASNFTKNRSFLINSMVPEGPPAPKFKPKNVNIFFNGASLAVGDVDNDLKADLVLGAQSSGQGNFRVLPNAAVASGVQSDVNSALSSKFTQPPNPPTGGAWQPTGGPAYHLTAVPMPTGLGFNAPLAVAVIEADGRDFRADVFAAFGGANQMPNNQVRRLQWDGSNPQYGSKWTATNHLQVVPQTKASVAVRFASGNGINLG